MKRNCCFFLFFLALAHSIHAKIEIRAGTMEGRKTFTIENELYRVVLIPEISRLPYSYLYKPTGREMFVHPVSLRTPNKGFQYYGGVVDAVPWVSGTVNTTRLPEKGLLYSSRWTCKTGHEKESVWFEGKTHIQYADPVTGVPAFLSFRKKITGYENSTMLKMDYNIKNIGTANARFTFSAHSRAGVAGWDAGDFFYAPGKECFVYEIENMPELIEKGIVPGNTARWPLTQAMQFMPQKEKKSIFVFVSSPWCVIGGEKYEEALFFIAEPINFPQKKGIMEMGIFMANAGYVVEPCLTRSITGNPEAWKTPGAVVLLRPKEECRFTLSLVIHQGITPDLIPEILEVHPECILLGRPEILQSSSGATIIQGQLFLSGPGTVIVKIDGAVVRERIVSRGEFSLQSLGDFSAANDNALSLWFQGSDKKRRLFYSFFKSKEGQ